MKSDIFVPFDRPQSDTVIIQLMTKLDFSYRRNSSYMAIPEIMYVEAPKGRVIIMFQEWPDMRSFCYLKYTFNKILYYSTKNSENERSIPVIGSFVYLKNKSSHR